MKMIVQAFLVGNIKRYFGFLFDRGYKIREIQYHPRTFGNWSVVLESQENSILISNDRDEILLSFAPVNSDKRDGIGIESMIYFLSDEKNFIGSFEGDLLRGKKEQFQRMAYLLKEYIDQIEPFFGDNFSKYKQDLLSSQTRYNNRFLRWRAAR